MNLQDSLVGKWGFLYEFELYVCSCRMNKKWFETWFESPYYELLYKDRDVQEARDFIDHLLSYLSPGEQAHFLDLACGKGRHSIYLHKNGFRVCGLDYSTNNIADARSKEAAGLTFLRHDMRNPLPNGPYDYILNLFTSFGYFETDQEHLDTLNHTFNALKPGGKLVMDFLNTPKVIASMNPIQKKVLEGIEFEITKTYEKGYIHKRISFKRQNQTKHFEEKVRAFVQDELLDLLHQAGYTAFECFGDYFLGPFNPEQSERLIIVANK